MRTGNRIWALLGIAVLFFACDRPERNDKEADGGHARDSVSDTVDTMDTVSPASDAIDAGDDDETDGTTDRTESDSYGDTAPDSEQSEGSDTGEGETASPEENETDSDAAPKDTGPPVETDSTTAPGDTDTRVDTTGDSEGGSDSEGDTVPPDTCLDLQIRFDGADLEEIRADRGLQLDAVCTVNGELLFVTRDVEWTSSEPSLITVDDSWASGGWVVPIGDGSAIIEAAYTNPDGSVTTAAVAVVSALPHYDIEISPAYDELHAGAWVSFTATCDSLNDNTDERVDCTDEVSWTSSDERIIHIGGGGGASVSAGGTVTIGARLERDSAEISVTVPLVISVRITPESLTVPLNTAPIHYDAECTLETGVVFLCTHYVHWESADPGVAVVSYGAVRLGTSGETEILASLDDAYAVSPLTVTAVDCSGTIGFVDANLEAAVRAAVGKAEGDLHIDDVSGLTELVLDDGFTTVSSLVGIECLTDLRKLGLNNHFMLMGSYAPIEDLSPLAALTSLFELTLKMCGVDDLTFLTNLTALTSLDLRSNPITDLTPLTNLTALTSLDLSSTPIQDITPLASLGNLKRLSIALAEPYSYWENSIAPQYCSNEITDFTPLASLTNLTELTVCSNHTFDGGALGHPSLVYLAVGAPAIQNLSAFGGTLIHLVLKSSGQLPSFEGLGRLETLDLSAGGIVDAVSFENLAALDNLTALDLSYNLLHTLPTLKGLPHLKALDLSHNGYLADLSGLAGLSGLRNLDASYNSLAALPDLSALTNLSDLYLNNNEIVDIGPLSNLPGLTTLSLSDNPVVDIEPLVENDALGDGAEIDLYYTALDCSAEETRADIDALVERGVTLLGACL